MPRQSIHDRIMTRPESSESASTQVQPLSAEPRSKWRLLRTAGLASLFAVAVAGAVVLALRVYPPLGTLVAGSASAQSQPSAESGTKGQNTPFQQHASQAGFNSCANVFTALGQALTLGSTYAIQTQWNNASPNAHPVQSVVGMTYDLPDYKSQAAGIVFVSPGEQGCEGNFVRVAPFQQSCQQVMQTLPQGSALAETLSSTMLVNLANNGGQALLVPNGNSCVVVSVARGAG